ncbi:hypothetical protein B0H11DRAFT_1732809, partial [Mycena galericulata]
PWLYLSYARTDQPVYKSYGAKNHAALESIKEKYDPENLLMHCWGGGFKLFASSTYERCSTHSPSYYETCSPRRSTFRS